MLQRALFGLALVLGIAPWSHAAIIISGAVPATAVATPGLPGYLTYIITATSTDPAQQIVGFDFASLPPYGFAGPMNQVNPLGLSTVFADFNAVITGTGGEVAQDSHFLFASNSVTVPTGFASESANSLRAVFAASAPLGLSVPFAQIVSNGRGSATGTVTVQNGQVFSDVAVNFTFGPSFPEPTTLGLFGLALASTLGFARHR